MFNFIAICRACGYQWNEDYFPVTGVFWMSCPVCEANMVAVYAPEKESLMGDDYDGMPWF